MNDETPINEEKRTARRLRKPRMPASFESAWFALQERVIWPLQDRFAAVAPEPGRRLAVAGGALALVAVAVVAGIALTSGSGFSAPTVTVSEAPAPRQPLIDSTTATAPQSRPAPEPKPAPQETLHGATPVFSPPSPASKGGEKTGGSKPAGKTTSTESAKSEAPEAAEASEDSSPAPDAARISSDPTRPATPTADSKTAAGAAEGDATAARATVSDGPPAGPEALKVAREFAQGFVVYETGGEKTNFRDAFKSAATPQLTRALLQRPPKQPAGVKVPKAKVLNVVAGPSQGSVYKVSVSLLRVGVTSELRLDMEKVKTAGTSGKSAEWRVTNVLG